MSKQCVASTEDKLTRIYITLTDVTKMGNGKWEIENGKKSKKSENWKKYEIFILYK